MVECGWHLFVGINPIEGFDPTVHAEPDRGVEALQKRLANRSLDALNPKPTGVNDI